MPAMMAKATMLTISPEAIDASGFSGSRSVRKPMTEGRTVEMIGTAAPALQLWAASRSPGRSLLATPMPITMAAT